MRTLKILATLLLFLAVAACSGIETRPAETDTFAAGNFRYYKWRTGPLENTINSKDPIYLIDPILRREVDAQLQDKGYILDPQQAQFTVNYISAPGLLTGEKSQEASNLRPYPTAVPNRQVNQAIVDNAHALGGVKETNNIGLMFHDTQHSKEVWRVIITKIVENVNTTDASRMDANLTKAIKQALRTLPSVE
jgi:hypothetical protein